MISVSYTHLDVYKRQSAHTVSFSVFTTVVAHSPSCVCINRVIISLYEWMTLIYGTSGAIISKKLSPSLETRPGWTNHTERLGQCWTTDTFTVLFFALLSKRPCGSRFFNWVNKYASTTPYLFL